VAFDECFDAGSVSPYDPIEGWSRSELRVDLLGELQHARRARPAGHPNLAEAGALGERERDECRAGPISRAAAYVQVQVFPATPWLLCEPAVPNSGVSDEAPKAVFTAPAETALHGSGEAP